MWKKQKKNLFAEGRQACYVDPGSSMGKGRSSSYGELVEARHHHEIAYLQLQVVSPQARLPLKALTNCITLKIAEKSKLDWADKMPEAAMLGPLTASIGNLSWSSVRGCKPSRGGQVVRIRGILISHQRTKPNRAVTAESTPLSSNVFRCACITIHQSLLPENARQRHAVQKGRQAIEKG